MEITPYRHPRILTYLFLTELWERFGYYVVQGLLVLYMSKVFHFSDDQSYTISGIFAGLVYISPFLGGFVADHVLGFKTAVIWGGLFLILGYSLLALSSNPACFYPALATIIVGNGLLKPNISSLLGTQYATEDPRRDSGFTIFYIGINIGAALSGISGYIRNAFGWGPTFAVASLGMIIGLLTFLSGCRYIQKTPSFNPLQKDLKLKIQLFVYCLLAIIGTSFLLKIQSLATWLLPLAGIVLIVFLVILTLQQNADRRKQMLLLNTLILSSIIFWMLFLQLFISANLYVDRLVDKELFGLHLTTTVFYASEGMFIILLGPLFAWAWGVLGRRHQNPSPVTKFTLGIFFAGLGFLVLSASTVMTNANGLVHPLWIFFSYLVITIGELLLSPIGLSAVTLLAPPHLIGMMMGIWFAALGFGGLFAGWIAKLSSIPDTATTSAQKLAIYQGAFLDYAYLAFLVVIILLFVQFGMKQMMRRV